MNFILFWILQFAVKILLINGFEYKTLCLLDYIPNEEELEGEEREWDEEGGGMGRLSMAVPGPGVAWGPTGAQPSFGYPNPNTGYYGEADEREADEWEGGGGGMGVGMMGREGGGMGVGMMGRGGGGGMGVGMMGGGGGGVYLDADGEWEDAKRRRRRKRRGLKMTKINEMRKMTNGVSKKRIKRVKRQMGYPWGRRPSPHTPIHLKGTLTCGPQHAIHVLKVTLGYTRTQQCSQASYYGCHGTSSKATQVIPCQGMEGSCDVTLTRPFLNRCGQRTNFAIVAYECIPASRRVDICSSYDSDETGSVVITSPSYPLVTSTDSQNGGVEDIVTCECTIRAPADASIRMEYLRARLPRTGDACEGDLLLLETPEPSNDGRYGIVSEICGTNYTTQAVDIPENILRVTFLGGSPVQHSTHGGFSGKFSAISSDGSPSLFHIDCLPPDGEILPNVEESPDKSHNNGNSQRLESGGNENGQGEESIKKNSPGVLSGVVASLASVILIMGSVGALLIYRSLKSRRQTQQERDRRVSIYSIERDDVRPPTLSNRDRFLTQPKQIVRTAPASAPRARSPVAPSFRAPPPPAPIYCIAAEVDHESEMSPEMAGVASLPKVVPLATTPVPPRRKNRESTASEHDSQPPQDVPQRSISKHAVPDPPYDNAASSPARKVSKVTSEGDETAENNKYEEPIPAGSTSTHEVRVSATDNANDDSSEKAKETKDDGTSRTSIDTDVSTDTMDNDSTIGDVDYSSIDEMHAIVTAGKSGDETDE